MSQTVDNTTNQTDYELWDAFRNGNEKAFADIFNTQVQHLFRYGVKIVADEEMVKDCMQELFIKLYNNRQNLGTTDNIRLYLFRALKNKILDSVYSQKEHVSLSSTTIPFEIANPEEPDQEDDWNVLVQKSRLKKSIESLTARQREAIYLRYTLEMSLDEISSLLEMNNQSTRNLLHRSVEKLRKDLLISILLLVSFFIREM